MCTPPGRCLFHLGSIICTLARTCVIHDWTSDSRPLQLILWYTHLALLVSRMTLYPLFHLSWITCISGIPLIQPHLVDSVRESAYLGPGARMSNEHLPPTFFLRSNSADLFWKVAVRSTFLSELLYSNVSRYTASHFHLVSAHKWCLLRRSVRIMGSLTFVYTSL